MTETIRQHTSEGLAKRAKELREKEGLTLQAVADRLKITRQAVHAAENPNKTGLDGTRIRIIEELGGNVVEFWYIEREPEQSDQPAGGAGEQQSKAA